MRPDLNQQVAFVAATKQNYHPCRLCLDVARWARNFCGSGDCGEATKIDACRHGFEGRGWFSKNAESREVYETTSALTGLSNLP